MVIKDGNMSTPFMYNPLNAELNSICHLLALLGTHHIFHVSELRVKLRPLLYVSQHVYQLHRAKILTSFAYTNNKFNKFKTNTKYIIIHLSMFVIFYVKISDVLEF
jgi:hypothetical protein